MGLAPETYHRENTFLVCDHCRAHTLLARSPRHAKGCTAVSALFFISKRQGDIALLLAQSKTAREIGDTLGITWKTVEAHKALMYRRLGVKGLAELIARLYDTGALQPKNGGG